MKVCTDSCLFGAWVADKIEKKRITPKTTLDIGSGTGLLSLMLAQKSKANIYAIEIDKNSFEQTKENFISSKWQQQLNVYHSDIKEWKHDLKYDLIISNPPFFENDLISEAKSKNVAKHHAGLSFNELIQSIKNNLTIDGNFAVLLPYHRIKYFIDVAIENNFYPEEEMLVKQTQKHNYFRGMLLFGTKKMIVNYNEIEIKNKNGKYSSQFQNLLKDYYLE
jgi:tRNA1Val (adenine37-N6)-methyltransferase